MIYDLSKKLQGDDFKSYANKLYKQKAIVELKERKPKRTDKQNNYLHLILSYFAAVKGYTLDEVKTLYYKTLCNRDIYIVERFDPFYKRMVRYPRSSSTLSVDEMNLSIERFKRWALEEADIHLPEPDSPEDIREAFIEVIQQEHYICG